MKSLAHPKFWKLYFALPRKTQLLADKAYAQWSKDFLYPSLHFKPLNRGIWSVRIGAHYRAVGHFEDKELLFGLGLARTRSTTVRPSKRGVACRLNKDCAPVLNADRCRNSGSCPSRATARLQRVRS